MTRPPEPLLDLVAGRRLSATVGVDTVATAVEHKVAGILKTAVDSGVSAQPDAEALLEQADISSWARNRLLRESVSKIAMIAAGLGIDVALLKGAAIEARWYSRVGERPSWDIDLLIAPWHLDRTAELVAALQPTHSILPYLKDGLRYLQSVDLSFSGLPVDLHLDPLKFEIANSRSPGEFWDRSESLDLGTGASVRVLGKEATLLLAGLHINKDRFRHLLGYSDLIRIRRSEDIDEVHLGRLLAGEGLTAAFRATMSAALSDLGLSELSPGGGAAQWVWNRAWPPSVRLQGTAGGIRFRHRQFILPFLDRRRWPDAAMGWLRRFFPPDWLLRRTYPEERGPYFVRLLTGRIRIRLARRRRRRSIGS